MQFIVYFPLYTECANHPNAFWLWFYYFLQNVLGSWSSKLFAIALLASGQSSTITGTYAGQYVMQVSFKLIVCVSAGLSIFLVFLFSKEHCQFSTIKKKTQLSHS